MAAAAAAVAWVPNKTSGRHAIVPQGGPAGYGEGNAHGKVWGKTHKDSKREREHISPRFSEETNLLSCHESLQILIHR